MNLGSFGKLSIVYGLLALLLIIELGLTGYLVSHARDAPSQSSFMLFTTIWSILVLLYIAITPVVIPSLFVPIVSLGLIALTMLFWFAGSIALAVFIGVPDCNGNNYCQCLQAAVAFGFFIWAIFTGLTVVEAMGFMRSRGPGANADVRSKVGRPYPGA